MWTPRISLLLLFFLGSASFAGAALGQAVAASAGQPVYQKGGDDGGDPPPPPPEGGGYQKARGGDDGGDPPPPPPGGGGYQRALGLPHAASAALNAADTIAEPVALVGNYPNPFNPETTIRFHLSTGQPVRLSVFNVLGRRVGVLVEGWREAGSHDVRFGADTLPTGIYFARMETNSGVYTRTMLLAR